MAEIWFEDLKNKIENFVSNASDEELDDAFEKASYDYYKNIKTPILWFNEIGTVFAFQSSFKVSIQSCSLTYTKRKKRY
jgi:hypothetical protein